MNDTAEEFLADEQVIYKASPHWIIFWPCLLWIVVTLFVFTTVPEIRVFGYVTLVMAVATWIEAMIEYLTSSYVVTDHRVLVNVGFIRKSSLEILLPKLEGIQVVQNIVGRVLGYGSVIILGTGGTKDIVYKIDHPRRFRNKVQKAIDEYEMEARG